MISQVQSIKFGFMGDDDIRRKSVCLVNRGVLSDGTGELYDPRMGIIDNSARCATCYESVWRCPGHFGHVELNIPIIVYYKQCTALLRCFCFNCGRLLCDADELKCKGAFGNYDRVMKYVSKLTYCSRCKRPHPDIRLNVNDAVITASYKFKDREAKKELTPSFVKSIFDIVPDEDVRAFGIDPEMFRPKNLVLTTFPVIPICGRPRTMASSVMTDDDLSVLLVDIIKHNDILARTAGIADKQKAYEKAERALRMELRAYCDNSKGKATHNTNRKPYITINQRLNTKKGTLRSNTMGKRCNLTARSVIGPDPTLKLNQIGVPEQIARILTMTEYVTSLNIEAMNSLVNDERRRATIILRKDGTKINVANVTTKHGTHLVHGDIIIRKRYVDGKEAGEERIVVTNCKMPLREGDAVCRRATPHVVEPVELPSRRRVELQIGDRVERHLANGDRVIINRQPTLHRNSMIGVEVFIEPSGKTFRLNLAAATQLNADFDGDECNMFVMNTPMSLSEIVNIVDMKRNMMSVQTNKSEIVIVQDSLLAAYRMTVVDRPMKRCDFYDCLMRTSAFAKYPDMNARLREANGIVDRSRRPNAMSTTIAFAFVLPSNFHKTWPTLTIRHGVITSGRLDKKTLNSGADSIVRLLYLEYGMDVASTFVDDVQFITNAWLESNPFSIGLQDCFMNCDDKKTRIRDTIYEHYMRADAASMSTENSMLREMYVNPELNKSKDIGLRVAKEALAVDNGFFQTVESGSKGDYFNIGQITAMLGQQNVDGGRPQCQLDFNTRSLPHYPSLIVDARRRYQSRGFVSTCFIDGLDPIDSYYHAMSGREGMANTAMGTATSGYAHRSCVKHNEDMKIAYDGSVRDARDNVYEFVYGNHGFDSSKVTFLANGDVRPVDVVRLADRLCLKVDAAEEDRRSLTCDEIERLVEACRWRKMPNIPDEIFDRVWSNHERRLRFDLVGVKVRDDIVDEFIEFVSTRFHAFRIAPGEAVGILSAQSIGQKQTQTNLNTFHTAGKLQESGMAHFKEFMSMSKKVKCKTSVIYFKQRYGTASELRDAIGSSIVSVTLRQACGKNEPTYVDDEVDGYTYVVYDFDPVVAFRNRIDPVSVVTYLRSITSADDWLFEATSSMSLTVRRLDCYRRPNDEDTRKSVTDVMNDVIICGISGITAMYVDKSDSEWFVVTEGGNMIMLMAHPLVDPVRLYTNDLWEIYDTIGIVGFRRFVHTELKKSIPGVNDCHIRVLVNKMTHSGHPTAINRYSMLRNDTGTLSKATYENMVHHFVEDSVRTKVDNMKCVSSALIASNQPPIGTGMFGLKIDIDAIMNADEQTPRITHESDEYMDIDYDQTTTIIPFGSATDREGMDTLRESPNVSSNGNEITDTDNQVFCVEGERNEAYDDRRNEYFADVEPRSVFY